jgi:hypothetical protein
MPASPGDAGDAVDSVEVGVAGENGEVMLKCQRSDPCIVVWNRSAFSVERYLDFGVAGSGLECNWCVADGTDRSIKPGLELIAAVRTQNAGAVLPDDNDGKEDQGIGR